MCVCFFLFYFGFLQLSNFMHWINQMDFILVQVSSFIFLFAENEHNKHQVEVYFVCYLFYFNIKCVMLLLFFILLIHSFECTSRDWMNRSWSFPVRICCDEEQLCGRNVIITSWIHCIYFRNCIISVTFCLINEIIKQMTQRKNKAYRKEKELYTLKRQLNNSAWKLIERIEIEIPHKTMNMREKKGWQIFVNAFEFQSCNNNNKINPKHIYIARIFDAIHLCTVECNMFVSLSPFLSMQLQIKRKTVYLIHINIGTTVVDIIIE